MKLLKYISNIIVVICIVGAIVLLFLGHFSLQSKFDQHWHYASQPHYDIELATRRISDNIPYQLTEKPKPKFTESSGYVHWYGCWR